MTDHIENDVYKGLPRRIFVGPATFRVVLGTAAEYEHLEGADGCAVFDHFKIYFDRSLNPQAALNVVIHEVTHCINWVHGITDDSTEEQFTNQHSNGTIEVWTRNPRLLNWQIKTLRRIKKESSHD